MISDESYGNTTYSHSQAGVVWSDMLRIRYLRRFIASRLALLDALSADPSTNAECILKVETIVAAANRELAKIEDRIFMA